VITVLFLLHMGSLYFHTGFLVIPYVTKMKPVK